MNGTEKRDPYREKDTLEELFRHVKVRQKPPAREEAAIREALHAQWQDMTAQRRNRRRLIAFAAAASATMAVFLGVLVVAPEPPAARQVATIERLDGPVFSGPENRKSTTPLNAMAGVATGQVVVTRAAGGLALRWIEIMME